MCTWGGATRYPETDPPPLRLRFGKGAGRLALWGKRKRKHVCMACCEEASARGAHSEFPKGEMSLTMVSDHGLSSCVGGT